MKTQAEILDLLHRFKSKHAPEYGIKRMGVFGSVARNTYRPDSDIDILYESDTITLFRMGGLLNDLENLLGTRVDLVQRHKYLHPNFVQRIEKDIIYV
ncbi:nucleotidyltransferase [Bacteroidia bacterium]|nr:nucleotidyltransferase [Bacteroidia bacterium]